MLPSPSLRRQISEHSDTALDMDLFSDSEGVISPTIGRCEIEYKVIHSQSAIIPLATISEKVVMECLNNSYSKWVQQSMRQYSMCPTQQVTYALPEHFPR